MPVFPSKFDAWAAHHPWQARFAPLAIWIAFLPLARMATEHASCLLPAAHAAQLLIVGGLLWRWRRLFPELSARLHLAALPVAALVLALWLGLGWFFRDSFPAMWDSLKNGTPPTTSISPLGTLLEDHPTLGWTTLGLRLLGMTLVVPVIEELFFRSAVPRAVPTLAACRTFLARLPACEWMDPAHTPPPPAPSLSQWPWFGVLLSAALFALNHQQADWAAAALTGLIWSALVFACNRARPSGLGPAIWSHALVNAALWSWCVARGDFAFM